MAHSNPPQFSPPGTVPASDDSGFFYRWQPALPGSGQEALTAMFAGATPAAINNGQLGTETHWHFPASQQLEYHQSEAGTGYVPDQNQFQQPLQHSLASGLPPADSDFNQHTTINLSQTFLYPLTPNSEPQTHEQNFHGGGSIDQPGPLLQGESEFPPIYLTSDTLPGTQTQTSSLLLAPPAYIYAANHPSSAQNKFRESLLQKGAHRLAYIFMDVSSDMWIYACNNTIGKDGPTEILMDRIVEHAGFRHMLKSPHLQAETCTVTIHVPVAGQRTAEGKSQFIEMQVPADVNDVDFMRAFRNELRGIPERSYQHLWKCSRYLLQPSALRRGIFANTPGSTIDAKTYAKLKWAFEENEEWGLGIFHEIIEDSDGFCPGRWFHNTDFDDMLQEGMFDISSPGWFGFIEATTDTNSSWKMTEFPTAHLFAVAISWFVITARYDFLMLRSLSPKWVSCTRVELVKAFVKFIEPWLLKFWKRRRGGGGVDTQIQSERAEGIGFMLRYRSSPLQAI